MGRAIVELNSEQEILTEIRKAIAGDPQAFEAIVKKYQKRIYYTILQIIMNHDDANDALQDTFIKAFTKLHTYDESYPFYPWLYRIAVNTSLNLQKKKARLRTLSLDDLDTSNGHHIELSESPQQMFDSEGNEIITKLKQALGKIPPEQRAVFVLRVSDGLSYQEISETLEISIGTVMSRLSRARDKLRGHLKGYIQTKKIEV